MLLRARGERMVEKILVVVFCHLIGDYVLQSDYIAKTKGENWYHLIVHSILYMVPFYICFGLVWQFPILLTTHIVIDSLKARYNKLSYVQDQILHYLVGLLYLL